MHAYITWRFSGSGWCERPSSGGAKTENYFRVVYVCSHTRIAKKLVREVTTEQPVSRHRSSFAVITHQSFATSFWPRTPSSIRPRHWRKRRSDHICRLRRLSYSLLLRNLSVSVLTWFLFSYDTIWMSTNEYTRPSSLIAVKLRQLTKSSPGQTPSVGCSAAEQMTGRCTSRFWKGLAWWLHEAWLCQGRLTWSEIATTWQLKWSRHLNQV